MSGTEVVEGIVLRVEPKVVMVHADGRRLRCSVRPRVYEENDPRYRNAVAVGDRVEATVEGGDQGVIERVLPRRNALVRPIPSDHGRLQVTAANVDQLVIVCATKDPPLRTGLVDRYLVAAAKQDMDPLLVVNKCDKGRPAVLREKLSVYERLGVPILFTSAKTGEGVEDLERALRGKTNLFVGHSGVGKSSLLNRIDPSLRLRVGAVARHGRGRHTTTRAELFALPSGGYVVDTPGIRGFGLADVDPPELSRLMPDLARYATRCRYPDCTHDHEPDCAVREAVERGDIEPARYESYLRMLHSLGGEEEDE